MLKEQRFASPRVVRRMYVMSFSHHYHYTTMSRNARPVFIVHCLHHCRTAIPNSAAFVVVPLRATRAFRRTCVYYGENVIRTLLSFLLSPPPLYLYLSLFLLLRPRGSRERRSRWIAFVYITHCVYIRATKQKKRMNRKEKQMKRNSAYNNGTMHCFFSARSNIISRLR